MEYGSQLTSRVCWKITKLRDISHSSQVAETPLDMFPASRRLKKGEVSAAAHEVRSMGASAGDRPVEL